MAIMAQNGLGMTVSALMAYKYMKASAEAGLALAQHGLGFMYLESASSRMASVRPNRFKRAPTRGWWARRQRWR